MRNVPNRPEFDAIDCAATSTIMTMITFVFGAHIYAATLAEPVSIGVLMVVVAAFTYVQSIMLLVLIVLTKRMERAYPREPLPVQLGPNACGAGIMHAAMLVVTMFTGASASMRATQVFMLLAIAAFQWFISCNTMNDVWTLMSILNLLHQRPTPPPPVQAIQSRWQQVEQRRTCFDSEICVICLAAETRRVLLPCRHLCFCASCELVGVSCPICRGSVTCIAGVPPIVREKEVIEAEQLGIGSV